MFSLILSTDPQGKNNPNPVYEFQQITSQMSDGWGGWGGWGGVGAHARHPCRDAIVRTCLRVECDCACVLSSGPGSRFVVLCWTGVLWPLAVSEAHHEAAGGRSRPCFLLSCLQSEPCLYATYTVSYTEPYMGSGCAGCCWALMRKLCERRDRGHRRGNVGGKSHRLARPVTSCWSTAHLRQLRARGDIFLIFWPN